MERVAPDKRELCYCIGRVAWGYILIHLHINIGRVDILPDWLGCLLMTTALPALSEEADTLRLLRPLGWIMMGWSLVNWIASIFTFNVDLYLLQVLISIISMYFHFQILTDIAGISMKYDTPEHDLLLKLRTVEVILLTAVALQTYGETYLFARYTTAFDLSSRLGLSVDFYQLVVGVMLFVTFAVTIWLCKLLFVLKKSLMRTFYIVDGRAEEDLIYEHISWNKSGWNPEQVDVKEEPLVDKHGIFDPEAEDFFEKDYE